MNKDAITAAKYGFVAFVACGWLLTSLEYRKEVRARKAAEARYEYDFDGVLEIGKTPPRVARYSNVMRDSLWVIDPTGNPDSVDYFRWSDSTWHKGSLPAKTDYSNIAGTPDL